MVGSIAKGDATMRRLRETAQLRTVDVASKMGIAESTVRNWEKGRSVPTLNFLQIERLMKLYGCKFEDLLLAWKNTLEQADGE